jgi:hypothetical protein
VVRAPLIFFVWLGGGALIEWMDGSMCRNAMGD